MPNVGDSTIPRTTVRPADDTTVLTLAVRRGDDTIAQISVAKTTDSVIDEIRQQTWSSVEPVEYTVPGEWVFTWNSDGTGSALEALTTQVAPNAGTSSRRSYATTADYAIFLQASPPAGARQKLIEASDAVDDMLFGAIYETLDGLPTDSAVKTAIAEATCAQAADTALEEKLASQSGGSFTIGRLSVTRPTQAAVPAPRPGVFYSAQAWRILGRAGLLGHAPWATL